LALHPNILQYPKLMAATQEVDNPQVEEQSANGPQIHLPSVDATKIAVLGAGAFGTAMAIMAARNGHEVLLWARNSDQVAHINNHHKNPKTLSDFDLPTNIRATTNLENAIEGAEIIIHALPAQTTPQFMAEHKDKIPAEVPVVITSKGLFLETKQLMNEAIQDCMGRAQALAYLSGPSFAKEILEKQPTAVVVASKNEVHATRIQQLVSNLFFRVYTSTDIVGVQLGGALKNPLAIGAGMIEGRGFGINTMAAFVTRAQLELMRLATEMGGQPLTISGLAGVGDLMLTAFGSLSRNRTTGIRLAKGESLSDITKGMTVEGVPTAAVALHYANQCGLDLPIFSAVAGILDGSLPIEHAHATLMGRPLRAEHDVGR